MVSHVDVSYVEVSYVEVSNFDPDCARDPVAWLYFTRSRDSPLSDVRAGRAARDISGDTRHICWRPLEWFGVERVRAKIHSCAQVFRHADLSPDVPFVSVSG